MHRAPAHDTVSTLLLTEAVRLREARGPRLDDSALLADLRAGDAPPEARVRMRALALAATLGWDAAAAAWRRRARFAALLMLGLAAILGSALAATVLDLHGERINLLGAAAGVLGAHLLALLLWIMAFAYGGAAEGGALGRAWLALSSRLAHAPSELLHAGATVLSRRRLGTWLAGGLSHACWALLLSVALLHLLIAFSLRHYGFVVETTLLEARTLDALITGLDALPGLFGYPTPDSATLFDAAAQSADTRRAWAGWLAWVLVGYGILPRLLLLGACRLGWSLALRRAERAPLPPDLAALGERLMPALPAQVTDPAPDRPHCEPPRLLPAAATRGTAQICIETEPDAAPPLAAAAITLSVDGAEERQHARQRLSAAPVRRLLLVCDARRSPDRGTLGLIRELAERSSAWRVLLLAADTPAGRARSEYWLEALAPLAADGVPAFTAITAAARWLEHGDD